MAAIDKTLGQKVGVLKAVPRKRALRNDAKKLSLMDALSEIIDNSIDNFAKQQKFGRVATSLTIDIWGNEDEVIIKEDSGGVTPGDLLAFVQVGAQGGSADSPHIGVWGAGQKLAVAALGSDVAISTRHWDERNRYEVEGVRSDQVVIRMDEDWWASEEDWDVDVYLPDTDLPVGETLYEIRHLNRRIDEDIIESVRDQLQGLYGDILSVDEVTLRLNGVAVDGKPRLTDEALQELFAFPPGFEPSNHYYQLEAKVASVEAGEVHESLERLKMEIIVGLTPHQEKAKSGVYMFGIPATESGAKLGPRMFAKALQDETVGYREGPRSLLRRGDPTLGRLRIYVIFEGDSELIPWGLPGSPVKRGYNPSNPFAIEIEEAIREAARPYVRFTSRAREIDFVPYSSEWNQMSDAERKALLRRSAFLRAPEDIDEPDVKPKVASVLGHEFKAGDFLEWDHAEAPEAPPKRVPAFDESLSKRLVSAITERDRALKDNRGNDPVEAVQTLVESMESVREEKKKGFAEVDADEDASQSTKPVQVTVRLPRNVMTRLTDKAGVTNRSEAIMTAVRFYIGDLEGGDE